MSKERDFKGVWIPKQIWLNVKLSPIEKLFLAEIDSLDNDEEKGCFASNEYFGNFFGISEGGAANIISSLRKRGYVVQVFFNGRVRGISLHENVKAGFMPDGSSLHENVKAGFTKRCKPVSRKREHTNIVDNKVNNKEENADANAPLDPPFKKTGEIEIPETNFHLNSKKEKNLQSGAGGGGAPGGQNGAAVRVTLRDPDLPGVEIVDEVKPEPQTPPEKTGRGKQTRTSEQLSAAQEVIDEINRLKGGRAFRLNEGDNAKEIIGRIKQGATVEEMKLVAGDKWEEWGNNPEMRRNYNPITLFRNCNFYRYLTVAEDRRNNPVRQITTRSTLQHFGNGDYGGKQAF